jgi:hypothetical protein
VIDDTAGPDIEKLHKAAALLPTRERLEKYRKIDRIVLHPRQQEFVDLTATCSEAALIGANQSGKSTVGAYILVMHLTGDYPLDCELYRKEGLRMLGTHATFAKAGYDFEAGIAEIATRLRDGRLKVARHLQEWFQEYRGYHRDEKGLVHKFHDDLMSATRMLCIQIRSAKEFDDHRPGFHAGEPYRRPQDVQFAKGSANHPDGPYDLFSV